MAELSWCPACGDEVSCEFGTCGDPDCLSRDCESHDACEPPESEAQHT